MPDDTRELIGLLAFSGLPSEDVEEQGRILFRVEDDAGLVGFGGWEGRGRDKLLCSVVVVPERQRQGLGQRALCLIETQAREAGAKRLHLLTTTAAPFFRTQGYQVTARSEAPESIRSSREFSSLCPSSATYMVKALSG